MYVNSVCGHMIEISRVSRSFGPRLKCDGLSCQHKGFIFTTFVTSINANLILRNFLHEIKGTHVGLAPNQRPRNLQENGTFPPYIDDLRAIPIGFRERRSQLALSDMQVGISFRRFVVFEGGRIDYTELLKRSSSHVKIEIEEVPFSSQNPGLNLQEKTEKALSRITIAAPRTLVGILEQFSDSPVISHRDLGEELEFSIGITKLKGQKKAEWACLYSRR
ncbi:hypothetical protein Tco_0878901 [Tanacetum coccineum]|uniref:Uncharacterized protein n=1 Tax=Tanacetum coccineum TaxID=301880 RepID=A0ABQ5BZI4_9ASTR